MATKLSKKQSAGTARKSKPAESAPKSSSNDGGSNPPHEPGVGIRIGRVWTDLYDEKGEKIAGIRTEDIPRVIKTLKWM